MRDSSDIDSSGNFQLEIFRRIPELLRRGEGAALASVIGVTGSCPGRHGMKMLLCRSGEVIGTVGGGMMEDSVLAAARDVLATGAPRRLSLSLSPGAEEKVGICGGEMEVYVEPIGVPTLYLFGSGHVAHAVSRVATQAGFRVIVLDDRRELATADRFPDADRIHVGPFPEIFEHVRPGPFS
jgi:xanthine dehydrogenase accessory factor